MSFSADISGNSVTGMVRKNNEDSFIATFVWDDSHILCAAIDGIGGYEGGEVAAEIARDTITRYVETSGGKSCLSIIKQAVAEANNEILRQKEHRPELSQMGCVVSAALIDLTRRCVNIAHVGDSRIYSFHNGTLTKISHDHSFVGYREEIGDLTEEEAMHHPQRNLIDRSLGDRFHMSDDQNFIDAAIFPIPEGESQYLFCSDGLSDMLTSAQIASVLRSGGNAETEVAALIFAANEAGGRDNITAVIAKIGLQRPEAPTPVKPDSEPAESPVAEPVSGPIETAASSKVTQPGLFDIPAPESPSDAATDISTDSQVSSDFTQILSTTDNSSVSGSPSGTPTESAGTATVVDNPRRSGRPRWVWIILTVLVVGILLGVGGVYLIDHNIAGNTPSKPVPVVVQHDTVIKVPIENISDSTEIKKKQLETLMQKKDSISKKVSSTANELDNDKQNLDKLNGDILRLQEELKQ